jgi:hypothetical protein
MCTTFAGCQQNFRQICSHGYNWTFIQHCPKNHGDVWTVICPGRHPSDWRGEGHKYAITPDHDWVSHEGLKKSGQSYLVVDVSPAEEDEQIFADGLVGSSNIQCCCANFPHNRHTRRYFALLLLNSPLVSRRREKHLLPGKDTREPHLQKTK